MSEPNGDIDWSKTTFEGSRREQLRRWRALNLRQRLEALDEMTVLAQKFSELRRSQGISQDKEIREPEAAYVVSKENQEIE
jgi:CRISPR-associated protein Csx17